MTVHDLAASIFIRRAGSVDGKYLDRAAADKCAAESYLLAEAFTDLRGTKEKPPRTFDATLVGDTVDVDLTPQQYQEYLRQQQEGVKAPVALVKNPEPAVEQIAKASGLTWDKVHGKEAPKQDEMVKVAPAVVADNPPATSGKGETFPPEDGAGNGPAKVAPGKRRR